MVRINVSKKSYKLLNQFVLLLAVVLIIGCSGVSHVKSLREVQDQFNSVAMMENQLKTDSLPSDERILLSGQSYRLILVEVTKLIKDKRQDLDGDKLLGTAYTLKALIEWRLKEYDEAVATTYTVTNENITLFSRDRALIIALRGLIKNDQAYDHMIKKDYEYKDLKRLLRESIENINEGVREAPQSHDVITYLYMAQLAAIKNWLDLYNEPKKYTKAFPSDLNKNTEQADWCNYAIPTWNNFEQEMDRINTQQSKNTKKLWGDRMDLPKACE